jgi:predicted nucleic acid-binding protein
MEEIQIGEREAIRLAQAIQSDYVLLDDRRARQTASDRGLNVIGTLGILTVPMKKVSQI